MTPTQPTDRPVRRRGTTRGPALGASTALMAAFALLAGAPGARRPGSRPLAPPPRPPTRRPPSPALQPLEPPFPRRPPASWLRAAAPAPGPRPACDLYAMTGTTPVLGRSMPIWGFSTHRCRRLGDRPGPLLVVDEGDTVSITLHNTLTEPVSLALPGQPASAFTTGLSAQAEEAGAAPGGTRTYTFIGRHGRARSSTRRATPPAARGRSPWAWPARSSSGPPTARRTARAAATRPRRTTTRRWWCSARSTPPSTPPRRRSTCAASTRLPAHQRQAVPVDRPGRHRPGPHACCCATSTSARSRTR